MSDKTKRNIFIYLGFIILAIVFYFISKSAEEKYESIQTFKQCVASGYPTLNTYPETCQTPDRRTFVNPDQQAATTTPVVPVVATSTSKDNYITVDSLIPDQIIKSPIIIKGTARGFWFFEAVFPVEILDAKGKVVGAGPAKTKSSWMTGDFVPFETTLTFTQPTTATGTIVFHRDNPSGDKTLDDQLIIPVRFAKEERTVQVYLYNEALDKDAKGNVLCSANSIVPVNRTIAVTKSPIQDTINLFLTGSVTREEKAQGLSSLYPLSGVTISAILSPKGELLLNVSDQFKSTSGGACRAGILRESLVKTVKQFPEVKNVIIRPDEAFQP